LVILFVHLSTMTSESTSVPHTTESHFVSFHRAHRSIKSEPHIDSPQSLLGFLPDEDLSLTWDPSSYHRLDSSTLPSDHRNSKLSPAISSITRKNYISSHRQDVLPLNTRPACPQIQPISQNGHSRPGFKSSSPPLNNSLNSHIQTTPPVFHNVSDLAAHHGIPQSLPPVPRAIPRLSSTDSSMSPTPEIEDFSSLCSEYLNMLSQDSVDPLVVNDTRTTPQPPASNDQEVVQAIMDVLMQGTISRCCCAFQRVIDILARWWRLSDITNGVTFR